MSPTSVCNKTISFCDMMLNILKLVADWSINPSNHHQFRCFHSHCHFLPSGVCVVVGRAFMEFTSNSRTMGSMGYVDLLSSSGADCICDRQRMVEK